MNNQEINRLWVLIDKFRGAFDTTELYKIMVYALLLKFLELKKDELDFYDKEISLGYLSQMYGKIIYSEHLLGYLAKVENFYNIEYDRTIVPVKLVADGDNYIIKRNDDSIVGTLTKVDDVSYQFFN